jgi:hypothetical protein
MKTSRKIMIFPILPDRHATDPAATPANIPSVQGFLADGNSAARSVPLPIIRRVFQIIKEIPPDRQPHPATLTGRIARTLLEQGMWTWNLPALVEGLRKYIDKYREERLELEAVEREMRGRLLPILQDSGLAREPLVEELVDQIISVFNSSSSQTSLQEISEKLQETPAFARLPEEVVDRCVDEFFDILFTRGYISFIDD